MALNEKALWLRSAQSEYLAVNNVADFRNLTAFTFEAWVKVGTNSTSPEQRAWYIQQGGTNKRIRFAMSAYTKKLKFEFARQDGVTDSDYTYSLTRWDDRWHHVAFACDLGDGTYDIMFDGVIVQSGGVIGAARDQENNPLPITDSAAQAVYAGRYTVGGDSTFWDGKLDMVRYWKAKVSDSTIRANMYDAIDMGANPNCLAEWRMESTGQVTIAAVKNSGVAGTWNATMYRGGSQTIEMWTYDRPHFGTGSNGEPIEDTTPPTVPTVTTFQATSPTSINLAWNEAYDNVYLQHYTVTLSTSNDFTEIVDDWADKIVDLSTSVTFRGLTPSTTYYARVRSVDSSGNASGYGMRGGSANIPAVTFGSGDVAVPTTPTPYQATNVTTTSFRMSWPSALDNSGVTGYKVDVALDNQFTEFVPGYQNRDVGDVRQFTASDNIVDSTIYYYRVRAYDASGNESASSVPIMVQTLTLTDIEPPLPVVPLPASSVESYRFTARWNEGIDNVGVTGYFLDVSERADFSTYVDGYDNLYVGNVVARSVSGLLPSTVYHYRVRARDASGNISQDSEQIISVATLPTSIIDDGVYQIAEQSSDALVAAESGPIKSRYLHAASSLKGTERAALALATQPGVARASLYLFDDNTRGVTADDFISQRTATYLRTSNLIPSPAAPPAGYPYPVLDLRTALSLGVALPTLESTQRWHVSFHVYFSTFNSGGDLLYVAGREDTDIDSIKITREGSSNVLTLTVDVDNSQTTVTSSVAMAADTWYSVSATKQGSTTRLVVNGTADQTTSATLKSIPRHRHRIGAANATQPASFVIGNFLLASSLIDMSTLSDVEEAWHDEMLVPTATPEDVFSVLKFPKTSEKGTPTSASLRLYQYSPTPTSITVEALADSDWDETDTRDTLPATVGDAITVTTTGVSKWIEIDVTSIIDLDDDYYSLKVSSNSGFLTRFGSPDDLYGYSPELLHDMSTEQTNSITGVNLSTKPATVYNLIPNPSLETAAYTQGASSNRTQTTAQSYRDGASLAASITGPNGYVYVGANVTLGFQLPGARTLLSSIYLRCPSEQLTLDSCYIIVYYTDGSSATFANTELVIQKYWTRATFPPVTTASAKSVKSAAIVLRSSVALSSIFYSDAAIVADVTELGSALTDFPYFDGNSPGASWEGTAHISGSRLELSSVRASASYIGEIDEDVDIEAFYRYPDDFVWIPVGQSQVTVDSSVKTMTIDVPEAKWGWNRFPNPQHLPNTVAYYTTTGATQITRHTNPNLGPNAGLMMNVPTGAGTITFGVVAQGYLDLPPTGEVVVWVYNTAGSELTVTLEGLTTDLSSAEVLKTVEISEGLNEQYIPVTLDYPEQTTNTRARITLSFPSTSSQKIAYIGPISISDVPVSKGDTTVGVMVDGEAGSSPTSRWLMPDSVIEVAARLVDENSSIQPRQVSDRIRTARVADNATTAGELITEPTSDAINVQITYSGDDDENNSCRLEWKRSDTASWSVTTTKPNRNAKQYTATITRLQEGASYDIRATFTDDQVFGENPLTKSVATTITLNPGADEPVISFGGFQLNGGVNSWCAVTKHSGFSLPARRVNLVEMPRQDGAVEQSVSWGPREITMEGVVSGATRAELAAHTIALKRALSIASQKLSINTLDTKPVYMTATLNSLEIPEEGGKNIRHLEWSATFTAADPFQYDLAETIDGPLSLTSGDTLIVDNKGDVMSHAVYSIRVTRAYGTARFTIFNKTTGIRITPNVSFHHPDTIEIDTKYAKVTKNGVEVDYMGSLPVLARGANEIIITTDPTLDQYGAPVSFDLSVRRRHKYL